MSKHGLSISENYVNDWGVKEALRELFQNAIDSDGEMEFSLDEENGEISLTSKGVQLPKKSLLLGYSNKGPKSIGKFGEGYKLALLVLVRSGLKVCIKNYGEKEIWWPRLMKSRRYKANVLVIETERHFFDRGSDLTFIVSGLTQEDFNNLRATNLHVNPPADRALINTPDGRILLGRPGEVFVKGLFVTKVNELTYGYDFNPDKITLDRDRRMASEFYVCWATSHMWAGVYDDQVDRVRSLLDDRCKDLQYINDIVSDHKSKMADGEYDAFVAKYGENAVPVVHQSQADEVPDGYHPVIVGNTRGQLVRSSSRFRTWSSSITRPKTPEEVLGSFYEDFNHELSEEGRRSFESILELSRNWVRR